MVVTFITVAIYETFLLLLVTVGAKMGIFQNRFASRFARASIVTRPWTHLLLFLA